MKMCPALTSDRARGDSRKISAQREQHLDTSRSRVVRSKGNDYGWTWPSKLTMLPSCRRICDVGQLSQEQLRGNRRAIGISRWRNLEWQVGFYLKDHPNESEDDAQSVLSADPMAERYTVLAFDAYGTLLSTESIKEELKQSVGQKAEGIAATWRKHQLEYTWRLNSMSESFSFHSLRMSISPKRRSYKVKHA